MTQQAATGELGPDAVLEGGDTDTERRCAYLELSLSLAGGLDGPGLDTLYKAAKPGILVRSLSPPLQCLCCLSRRVPLQAVEH